MAADYWVLGVISSDTCHVGAANIQSVWLCRPCFFFGYVSPASASPARSAAIPTIVGRENLQIQCPTRAHLVAHVYPGACSRRLCQRNLVRVAPSCSIHARFCWPLSLHGDFQISNQRLEKMVHLHRIRRCSRCWKYVRARPKLMATVLAKTPPTIANAGAWVTLNLVAGVRLSFTTLAVAIGIMQCIRAIGTGIGPMLPESIIPKIVWSEPSSLLLVLCFSQALIPLSHRSLGCHCRNGMGHNWVLSAANLQAATPDHLLGRVTSIDFFLFSAGGALSAVMAGLLCDLWNDPAAGSWSALTIGMLIWLYCYRLSRQQDPLSTEPLVSGSNERKPHI